MNMMRGAAALIIGASLLACAPDTPSQSAEVKIGAQSVIEPEGHALIDGLIAQMTLEEKIGQMTLFSANWSDTGAVNRESWREDVKAGKVGAVFSLFTAQKPAPCKPSPWSKPASAYRSCLAMTLFTGTAPHFLFH